MSTQTHAAEPVYLGHHTNITLRAKLCTSKCWANLFRSGQYQKSRESWSSSSFKTSGGKFWYHKQNTSGTLRYVKKWPISGALYHHKFFFSSGGNVWYLVAICGSVTGGGGNISHSHNLHTAIKKEQPHIVSSQLINFFLVCFWWWIHGFNFFQRHALKRN